MAEPLVSIEVGPEFLAEQSDVDEDRYVFTYHIRIRNAGPGRVQLLRRHWLITDANGDVNEVHGDGVVGRQPVIEPGSDHAYSSFCVLPTPFGVMQGRYTMRGPDGREFEVEIPLFRLAVPGLLN